MGAHEMATLLIGLGDMLDQPRERPLRFISTNAGNAWFALIVAAYVQRAHGGKLEGMLVADGKSEWMQAGDVRKLMHMAGLSYRLTNAFEASAELALLSHDPTPNRGVYMYLEPRK